MEKRKVEYVTTYVNRDTGAMSAARHWMLTLNNLASAGYRYFGELASDREGYRLLLFWRWKDN